MFSFLVKRLFQALIVMFVISLVAFAIQDNLGDPLRELVGQSVSESERQALRDELGLNDPFITKYTRFVGNALQGALALLSRGTHEILVEDELKKKPFGLFFVTKRITFVLLLLL